MVDVKAKVVLGLNVYKQINWLTHNHDKEIGAVGTGNIKEQEGEKYFHIDELFFPDQFVTGASVHFTPEMWGSLIRNPNFLKKHDKVCFYWHKHPSNAHCSTTDEEDTFDSFMSPDTKPKRKYFIFLQTAIETNGHMETESRIDIRVPIRATILDKNIMLKYELPPEDKQLAKDMENIIKTCIKEPKPTTTTFSSSYNSNFEHKPTQTHLVDYETDAILSLFNIDNNGNYIDNDMIGGKPTEMEEKVGITFVNGNVEVRTGKIFNLVMKNALHKKGKIYSLVREFSTLENEKEKGITLWKLQPAARSYKDLRKTLFELFVEFHKVLETQGKIKLKKTETLEDKTEENKDGKYIIEGDRLIISNDNLAVLHILSELGNVTSIRWVSENHCVVSDVGQKKLGSIITNTEYTNANISGEALAKEVELMLDCLLNEGVLSGKFVVNTGGKNGTEPKSAG